MRPRRDHAFLLLILLLGWGLRLGWLDFQELRGDEVFGYFFSLRPMADMVQATVDLQEPHPIASYLVQQQWLGWAGHSEFALRFVSVWFGMLAVVLLWSLARALGLMPKTALVATLLLAINPYAIWHSQDARMYSMSLALTLASTWCMIAWRQRQRTPWAVAYVLISWLALHTHYFTVFVLLAQNLFIILRLFLQPMTWTARRWVLSNWLTLQITIAFFYGPWLLRVQETLTSYRGNGDSPPLTAMLWRAGSVLLVGESVPANQRLWWALLAGGVLLWGVVTLVRTGGNERRALTLLLLYLGIPLLATWWSATQRPIFNERYLVAATPPFLLLLAAALTYPWHPRAHQWPPLGKVARLVSLWIVLAGMQLSLFQHYRDPAYSKTRGWRVLAATLTAWSAQLSPAQVRIAQNFPDPTLWYYYTGPLRHVVLPPGPQDEAGAYTVVQALATEGVQRVILPQQPAPQWDDQGLAGAALATAYQRVAAATVGVWPVQLYVAPLPLTPHHVTFTNGLTLTGFAHQPATLTPDNVLAVQLGWQGAATQLTGSEKVFVQLLNEAGQLVAQDDQPFPPPATSTSMTHITAYGILLPTVLPAGDYTLITGLYDPSLPGAPRIATTAGRDHVVIATLPVAE
ncbi:MAG: glycosyltransferase family 39 protein [Caldilineaceae bacterium]|nr:glycosyltransferase family 39 protein [Caldilineaceae bacterium]